MMPFITTITEPSVLECGCALASVTRPWVAQRVWPTPVVRERAAVGARGLPQGREVADRAHRLGQPAPSVEQGEPG